MRQPAQTHTYTHTHTHTQRHECVNTVLMHYHHQQHIASSTGNRCSTEERQDGSNPTDHGTNGCYAFISVQQAYAFTYSSNKLRFRAELRGNCNMRSKHGMTLISAPTRPPPTDIAAIRPMDNRGLRWDNRCRANMTESTHRKMRTQHCTDCRQRHKVRETIREPLHYDCNRANVAY